MKLKGLGRTMEGTFCALWIMEIYGAHVFFPANFFHWRLSLTRLLMWEFFSMRWYFCQVSEPYQSLEIGIKLVVVARTGLQT